MDLFSGFVTGLSRLLDRIAGFCMVAVMVLIVSNVILRAVFKHPIMGAYEYATYLTAMMIGLAVAYCAVLNGHIAVDFLVDRFHPKVQAVIEVVVNAVALVFWSFSTWHVAKYAASMYASNVVAPTTRIPVYPFIYVVACSLLVLCLVLLARIIHYIKKAAIDK